RSTRAVFFSSRWHRGVHVSAAARQRQKTPSWMACNMKRAWLSAVLSALLAAPGAAQQGELGVNLSWWTNYHPEWVFVDAFKGAAEWVPQRVVGGPWNTGEPIAQRPDGYPAWLAPGQAVCTL